MEWFISHRSALEFWRRSPAKVSLARKPRGKALPRKPRDSKALPKAAERFTLPLHILVGSDNARKVSCDLRSHINAGTFPRGSFVQGGTGLIMSSPELCFLQMASELSLAELIMLGFELCGTYRIDKISEPDKGFRNDLPLTNSAKLDSFIDRAIGHAGTKRARKALRYITDGSASPMETVLTMLLTLPYRLGGYGFPMPSLNYPLFIETNSRSISQKKKYVCDLYWPGEQIDVEYDSNAFHTASEKMKQDAKRRNTLSSAGVVSVTVTKDQLQSVSAFHDVAIVLSKLLEKRLQPPMPQFTARRIELRESVLPKTPRDKP